MCISVSVSKPDLVCVSESWLHSNIVDSLLFIEGYCLLRDDRIGRKGGGVCVWVKNLFCPTMIVPLSTKPDCMESIIFSLPFLNITCFLLYIPPGLISADHQCISSFLTSELDRILLDNPNQHVIVCGDLNDFASLTFTENFNLVNKVTSPTRSASFLDQIWLDENLSRHYDETAIVGPPIGNSDHSCVILIPTEQHTSSENRTVLVWDYRASNLANFTDCLASMDFSFLTKASNVDEMCHHFYEMFYSAMTLIPFTFVTMSEKEKPWMTPTLKLLINRRWESFRCRNWKLFSHYKRKVKEEIIRAKIS